MRRFLIGGAALALAAAALTGCGRTQAASPPPATSAPKKPQHRRSLVALVARERSGILKVEAFGCDQRALGTGFLVSPRLVATVQHVIEGAQSIHLIRAGKLVATGTVIGADAARDVALVRTDRPVSGYVFHLATRRPALAEPVAAIGFPLGLPLSISRGVVSGSDRVVEINGIRRRKLVQTDAAVNHGNSGGPLISTVSGEVIGLVDLGATEANGLAFAVAAQVARPLLNAWKVAPQPVAAAGCESAPVTQAAPPQPQPSSPPPSQRRSGSLTSFTGRYFSVSYPTGWRIDTAEEQEPGYMDTTIRDPVDPDVYLRVDVDPDAGTYDPIAASAPVVAHLRAETGYQERAHRLATFDGYSALYWEYLVPEHGVLLHKVNIMFVDENREGFGVLTESPASEWQAWAPTFETLRDSLTVG